MKYQDAKRMWVGGPLRRFSIERISAGWTQYDGGGYAGPYVCEGCDLAVSGIYHTTEGWRCAECRYPRGKSKAKNDASEAA